MEIRTVAIAGNDVSDAQTLSVLLEQIPDEEDIASRVETKMHCIKLLGQRADSTDFDRQITEVYVRVAILNRSTALGTPLTQAVA